MWNIIKPFLTNKGLLTSNGISLTQKNVTVKYNSFSNGAKIATARPICKKNDRDKIEDYRPAGILNCFSKVYERLRHEQFKPFVGTIFSGFVVAYRERYSCNDVLMRLMEKNT